MGLPPPCLPQPRFLENFFWCLILFLFFCWGGGGGRDYVFMFVFSGYCKLILASYACSHAKLSLCMQFAQLKILKLYIHLIIQKA